MIAVRAVEPAVARPWRFALRLGAAAFVVNAGLYTLGVVLGVFSSFALLSPPGGEISLLPILLVTIGAVLAAVGLYRLLRQRVEDPFRTFALLSVLLLLFSFGAPVGMGWAASQGALLNLMHVVVALLVVAGVRYLDRSDASA